MVISKGDILLAQFPFTDLSQTKLRPAIVLYISIPKNEVTLCFISSQKLTQIGNSEFLLLDSDPDFPSTGLSTSSKVRVSRIVTLNHQMTSRRLGRLGISHMNILNIKLKEIFDI